MKIHVDRLWACCLLVAVMWVWAAPAAAVDPGKTSYTAEAVCAFRAIGATDPDPGTRNPDHMAQHFVNPAWEGRFPGLGLDFEGARIAMDRMDNGVYYYVTARTLHMDAMLTRALEDGARQVVILGAGFDSRAYRFHDAYPRVRFFEIDLPATSNDKQRRVEKILGKRPDWVRFVAIDFNVQTLEEVLTGAGFTTDQKTFYVWEGVTYFISGHGVDSTLRFIAGRSAPGSRVVFDYMLEDVVLGLDYSAYGARRTVYGVAMRGEPYVFGIAPERLEAFVNLRGLSLLSDLGPADLSRRYLVRSNGDISGRISEFLRIVLAEVPPPALRDRLRRLGQNRLARAGDGAGGSASHRVEVPDAVQDLLSGYSRSVLQNDREALTKHFAADYLFRGHSRDAVVGFLLRRFDNRPIRRHEIVLTRFEQNKNHALIDGFVHREGFRTPLMVRDIVQGGDGRWRWYGDRQ